MRVFLKIEYDGTNYSGWQIQPNGNTVQAEIESALKALTGEEISVTASGRTDSGVHAAGQVAHFDTESAIPPERFAAALNAILPCDIKIIESKLAPDGFHARFSAKKKTYVYTMYESDFPRPLLSRFAAKVSYKLDVSAMQDGASHLLGEHDFSCFLATNSSVKDTVRTIYRAEVIKEGELIRLYICGNGFLYNMVRIIAGTLVKIGSGKILPEEMKKIIDGKERSAAGMTMPPEGLTLLSVDYE